MGEDEGHAINMSLFICL